MQYKRNHFGNIFSQFFKKRLTSGAVQSSSRAVAMKKILMKKMRTWSAFCVVIVLVSRSYGLQTEDFHVSIHVFSIKVNCFELYLEYY